MFSSSSLIPINMFLSARNFFSAVKENCKQMMHGVFIDLNDCWVPGKKLYSLWLSGDVLFDFYLNLHKLNWIQIRKLIKSRSTNIRIVCRHLVKTNTTICLGFSFLRSFLSGKFNYINDSIQFPLDDWWVPTA